VAYAEVGALEKIGCGDGVGGNSHVGSLGGDDASAVVAGSQQDTRRQEADAEGLPAQSTRWIPPRFSHRHPIEAPFAHRHANTSWDHSTTQPRPILESEVKTEGALAVGKPLPKLRNGNLVF
jgi:hypothetical protein